MKWRQEIDPRTIPENLDPANAVMIFKERALQYISIAMTASGTLGFILLAMNFIQRKPWVLLGIYAILYLLILGVTCYRSLPYTFRAGVILIVLYLVSITSLITDNLILNGRIYLLVFTFTAIVFLGPKVGILSALLSSITMTVTSLWLTDRLILIPPLPSPAISSDSVITAILSIAYTALAFLLVLPVAKLLQDIERKIISQEREADELRQVQTDLDQKRNEYVLTLKQKAEKQEAISRISCEIAECESLDDLLNKAVSLMQNHFGWYHVGIYLLDNRHEVAILRAAAGSSAQALLRVSRHIKVDESTIMGEAISKGEARVVSDVNSDPFFLKHPLLLDTRSELALPLKTGGGILGAVDILSSTPDAFQPDDVNLLQSLATQVAISIEKTSQIERLQSNLNEIKTSYKEQILQSWQVHLANTRKKHSYRYKDSTLESDVTESASALEAYATGKIVRELREMPGTDEKQVVVSIPIQVRQQTIGVLEVNIAQTQASQDMIDLLDATTQRIAMALENARLMESIRVRAERERTVSNISAQVRAAADIDSILRKAASELGKTMGVSEVLVQLRSDKL